MSKVYRHKITGTIYATYEETLGGLAKVTTSQSPYPYIVSAANVELISDSDIDLFSPDYPVPAPKNKGTSFLRGDKWVTITASDRFWLNKQIADNDHRLSKIPNAEARQTQADYVAALKARLAELNA